MISRFLCVILLFGQLSGFAQTIRPIGYPDRSPSLDVLPGFIHLPKGYGEVKLWIDGTATEPIATEKHFDGLNLYAVTAKETKASSSQVVLNINYQPGFTGGAAIPQYFKQQ